jgi:cystathionine gamma-synthase
MRRHSENAARVARFLADSPAVSKVFYPGLPDDPNHSVARKNFASGGGVEGAQDGDGTVDRSGFGGMVSFLARGGQEAAMGLVARTRLFTLAESLGGVESLIEYPAQMTHASLAGSSIAIDPALVRLSVGIEDPEDLIADLHQALS